MRAAILLLLAMLAPAFAADSPSSAERSGPPEPPDGYAYISIQEVIRVTDLFRRMTDALHEQDTEIQRLRGLLARGGCA